MRDKTLESARAQPAGKQLLRRAPPPQAMPWDPRAAQPRPTPSGPDWQTPDNLLRLQRGVGNRAVADSLENFSVNGPVPAGGEATAVDPIAAKIAALRPLSNSKAALDAEMAGAKDTLRESEAVANSLKPAGDALPSATYWFARLYAIITDREIAHHRELMYPEYVLHFIPQFYGMYRQNLSAYLTGASKALAPANPMMYAAAIAAKDQELAPYLVDVVGEMYRRIDDDATKAEVPARKPTIYEQFARMDPARSPVPGVTPSWHEHFSAGAHQSDAAVELVEGAVERLGFKTPMAATAYRALGGQTVLQRRLPAPVQANSKRIMNVLRDASQLSYIKNITDATIAGVKAHIQGDMADGLADSYLSFYERYAGVPEFMKFHADFFANNKPSFTESREKMVSELFGRFGVSAEMTRLLLGAGDSIGVGSQIDELYEWREQAWTRAKSRIDERLAPRASAARSPGARVPSRYWPVSAGVTLVYDGDPLRFTPATSDGVTGVIHGGPVPASSGAYTVLRNNGADQTFEVQATMRGPLGGTRSLSVRVRDGQATVTYEGKTVEGTLSGGGSVQDPFKVEYRDPSGKLHSITWRL